jgi:hypothetical protein
LAPRLEASAAGWSFFFAGRRRYSNFVARRAESTIEAGRVSMKENRLVFLAVFLLGLGRLTVSAELRAQEAKPSGNAQAKSREPSAARPQDAQSGQAYSGMYSFLKEGEFLQVTVEDAGHVTGFVSRFGDGESDKGAFLDQFFKSGKLEGNKLSFTTEMVHGIAFDFKGTVERGEGKNPGDEGYFVLKGTLTESTSDVNKKVSSHSREVVFKMFPQDAAPAPAVRN